MRAISNGNLGEKVWQKVAGAACASSGFSLQLVDMVEVNHMKIELTMSNLMTADNEVTTWVKRWHVRKDMIKNRTMEAVRAIGGSGWKRWVPGEHQIKFNRFVPAEEVLAKVQAIDRILIDEYAAQSVDIVQRECPMLLPFQSSKLAKPDTILFAWIKLLRELEYSERQIASHGPYIAAQVLEVYNAEAKSLADTITEVTSRLRKMTIWHLKRLPAGFVSADRKKRELPEKASELLARTDSCTHMQHALNAQAPPRSQAHLPSR